MDPQARTNLSLLAPPYRELTPVDGESWAVSPRGRALIWDMGQGHWKDSFESCRTRTPGLPLIVVLPCAMELGESAQVLRVVEKCRPHSVLPHHFEPDVEDLKTVLRRTPRDLPLEVMDYIQWRGIHVDLETRRMIRRTMSLSVQVKTVGALARSFYLSRRALGRRFLTRGIPVPSHWLHFGRVLKAVLKLQNSRASLMSVAFEMGYSDGFTLSNQMERLTGVRPRQAREMLGWEWAVEAWLQNEARTGGLSMTLHRKFRVPPQRVVVPAVHRFLHARHPARIALVAEVVEPPTELSHLANEKI
jgi:AraC-like DNA-binding protein